MGMRVHELHPAVVHAPLVLLPLAAVSDLRTALRTGRWKPRDPGPGLWWAAAGSALFAGLAGFAASQEAKAGDHRAERMMWIHGLGNVGIVAGAIGIAAYRTSHRANVPLALTGLAACGASMFTAYLGGEMVYGHGVGVRAMQDPRAGGDSPPLLSLRALPVFLRDAVRGMAWLFGRTVQAARRIRRLRPADEVEGLQPVSGY